MNPIIKMGQNKVPTRKLAEVNQMAKSSKGLKAGDLNTSILNFSSPPTNIMDRPFSEDNVTYEMNPEFPRESLLRRKLMQVKQFADIPWKDNNGMKDGALTTVNKETLKKYTSKLMENSIIFFISKLLEGPLELQLKAKKAS
jgi:hypothetical protein